MLRALSGAGLDVVVDAAPLSALGELAAVMAGVGTLTHHHVAGELHHRYPLGIRSRPAGSRPRQTVHALHRCGTTWPAMAPVVAPVAPDVPDDHPPF